MKTTPYFEAIRVREVEVRYKLMKDFPMPTTVHDSRHLFTLFRERMNAERVETMRALLLDTKNQLIGLDLISRGSLNTAVVHPREVFTNAVRLQAHAVILMHNHPAGDPCPSNEDKLCTERLVKASTILGIKVVDHIVFGLDDYFSFADSGLLNLMRESALKLSLGGVS